MGARMAFWIRGFSLSSSDRDSFLHDGLFPQQCQQVISVAVGLNGVCVVGLGIVVVPEAVVDVVLIFVDASIS